MSLYLFGIAPAALYDNRTDPTTIQRSTIMEIMLLCLVVNIISLMFLLAD